MWALLSRWIDQLAWWTALAGGLVLILVISTTVISITGRSLTGIGLAPIPGDFEIVEIGMGFAIFSFLPWCQIRRGHAVVDLLQGLYGKRGNSVLNAISQLLMLLMAILLSWRLGLGMMDKKAYLETTYILLIPVWWGYLAAFMASTVMVLVAIKCFIESVFFTKPVSHEVGL